MTHFATAQAMATVRNMITNKKGVPPEHLLKILLTFAAGFSEI